MNRSLLQKIIRFNEWHVTESTERTYAVSLISHINRMIKEGEISGGGYIIEVGCGLGDIISEINWKKKCGYDIEKRVIIGAKIVHFGNKFKVGTFDSLRDKKIECLVAVNFMHRINTKDLNTYFDNLFDSNDVVRVVVDQVSSPPYQFSHDYRSFMGKYGYELEYESKGFVAMKRSRRKLLVFKKEKEIV